MSGIIFTVTNHKSREESGLILSSISSSPSSSEKKSTRQQESSDGSKIVVDVKGNVKNPGIYTMKTGMRVSQAIDLASGFLSSADQKQINLAQKVTDEMVVYVPAKGEVKSSPVSTGTQSSSMTESGSATSTNDKSGSNGATVNLNTATKEQLQELTGIGPKKAEQILQYREEHQSFKTTDEIKEVGGIGDKTFESLKDSLSV